MNKFEKLIEYIINDEDQKARELFHDIVVEKSRDIYESIMDEESMEEHVAGNQVEDMVDQVSQEEAMGEDEEEGEEFELGGEEPAGEEEFGGEEEHVASDEFGRDEEEDKILNIDAKLDELLAKFDEIMGDEGTGEEMPAEEPAMDMGHEQEVGAEEEPAMFEGENPFAKGSGKSGSAKSGVSGKSGSAASGKSGSAKSGKSGKPFEGKQSTSELMREYVDRIGDIYGGQGDAAEGDAVGAAGKKTSVNTNVVSKQEGPDFGGTSANIAKGGSNESPDGKPTPKPTNEYTKGQGEIKSGNVNVPGGKAGKPQSTGHEYTKDAKGAEGKTTAGTVPVAKKSVQVQNTGKK